MFHGVNQLWIVMKLGFGEVEDDECDTWVELSYSHTVVGSHINN